MKNPSGIQPLEFNILVSPNKAASEHTFKDPESGREFSLIKPDDVVDRETMSATTGTVVAVSKTAFTFENGAEHVEPGDEVLFVRYAGVKTKGKDGEDYLILKDKDVAAVYKQEAAA